MWSELPQISYRNGLSEATKIFFSPTNENILGFNFSRKHQKRSQIQKVIQTQFSIYPLLRDE